MSGPAEVRAYLCLGGNIGSPRESLSAALKRIDADRLTRVETVSSLYRTPPWGKLDQPEFLNAVASVLTTRSPRALLDLCLDIEVLLKRSRGERWGPRLIDIDVLLYGDRSVKEVGLEIPHPRMFVRAFVLVPLAEIAPNLSIRNVRVASYLAGLDVTGIDRISDDGNWWRG
ncbi:MAG: 2-amino-4-hydroxy-6-hydroxymethyldihydropteridine diphosphokinase [Mesorhizobium sp.]|nr:2-amino-4-hydroxy-6-hydroxymethyldihydropteridine diphosphokinase [Mesorhizobium sp.]